MFFFVVVVVVFKYSRFEVKNLSTLFPLPYYTFLLPALTMLPLLCTKHWTCSFSLRCNQFVWLWLLHFDSVVHMQLYFIDHFLFSLITGHGASFHKVIGHFNLPFWKVSCHICGTSIFCFGSDFLHLIYGRSL